MFGHGHPQDGRDGAWGRWAILRVLIVDDDDFDREACRRVLESDAWDVVDVATPEEANAILDDETPLHAIISDYDLKAAHNGIDVLTHATRTRPTARRILMSGLIPHQILSRGQQEGQVQAFIEKPDTLDGWRRAVIGALHNGRTNSVAGGGLPNAAGLHQGQAVMQLSQREAQGQTREQALEERVRWLNAVVDLGAEAHRGARLQETFDRAVLIVSEMLEMEYTKILKLLPGGKEVLLVAGVGWREGLVGKARVSTGMDSQAGYTLASEHPVVAEDLRAETRFSGPALLHEHGVVSGLSVVIPGEDGRPWGVFGAHTKQRRRLTEEHVLFLRAVANVVAGAIARDRTEDALRNTKEVLEREVAERTRLLRVAVDDLQAFNAMVAHDLRAPLRATTLSIDRFLIDHGADLDPDARHLLARVEKATTQMRNLLEDLLGLAKATQDPLEMQEVDVTALAQERWDHVRQREPEREVEFILEEGMGAHADPRLLAVVFDNLLGNALKFTRQERTPVVEVGTEHLAVGGTAFFVRDNGAGFQSDLASHLFHTFKRLHSTAEFEGTGIGLATVRRIIERHGGTVWAESGGPGKGATVYFRLLPVGLP